MSLRTRIGTLIVAWLAGCFGSFTAQAESLCQENDTSYCLNQERFRVAVTWRDDTGPSRDAAADAASTEASGLFSLGGERLLVKVLNGCSINDRVWVFGATPTALEYEIRVEDTQTGAVKTYVKPLGERSAALTDIEAFATCTHSDRVLPLVPGAAKARTNLSVRRAARWSMQKVGSCVPDPTTACLEDGRFRVELDWRSFDETAGPAHAVPAGVGGTSSETALFWFFGPDNWEALVRVEDRCDSDDVFRVRAAASTNVAFDLTVTDTVTGASRSYSNPLGDSASPIVDDAFSTCDAVEDLEATVRFVSDQSVNLSTSRTAAELEVEVVDAAGDPVPGAVVTWASEDPGVVGIEPTDDLTAAVRAVAAGPAHAVVTARFGEAEARSSVLLTETHPNTVLIDSAVVLQKEAGQLSLARTGTTESLGVTDIVVSGDRAGVLARIDAVDLQADRVVLTTRPVAITEAFRAMNLDVEGRPTERRVLIDPEERRLYVYDTEGRLLAKRLLDDLECEVDGQGVEIDFEGPDVSLGFEMRPRIEMEIDFFELQRFSATVTGSLSLDASTGGLHFDAAIRDEAECSITLPTESLPPLPVGVFTFTLGLTPKLGVQASAEFNGPTLDVTGPEASAQGLATGGIVYTESGWETIADASWSGDVSLGAQVELDPNVFFDTAIGPFAGFDAGVVVELGRGFLGVELADVRFAEIRGYSTLRLGFPEPLDPAKPEYRGPRWDLLIGERGDLKADLAGGLLADLLDRLDIPTGFDAQFELFAFEELLAGSPRPAFIEATTSSESCAGLHLLDPATGEEALFAVQGSEGEGSVELWGGPVDDGLLERLAEDEYSDRLGIASWTPEPSQTGTYRFYPRLVIDDISAAAPYGAGAELFESIVLAGESGGTGGVPVIDSIEPQTVVLEPGGEASFEVQFHDSDAGVELLDFDVVLQQGSGTCIAHQFDVPEDLTTRVSGTIEETLNCSGGVSDLRCVWDVFLLDCQGNRSAPATLEGICETDS